MEISFWGVRGSIPSPGRHTWRYGGNTPSLEVRAAGQLILLDAGSGIRELGHQLILEAGAGSLDASLLLTHYHWDHIQGLPFFLPIYIPGHTIRVFGPRPNGGVNSVAGILDGLFASPFFPIQKDYLKANLPLTDLGPNAEFALGNVRVRTCSLRHPQGSTAYRLETDGVAFVYATDHEPGDTNFDRNLRSLARGADLLITDAQYRPEELAGPKAGWGHGSWETAARLAAAAEVKNLVLFHHEPLRGDEEIDQFLAAARREFPRAYAATEGLQLELTRKEMRLGQRNSFRVGQRAEMPLPVHVEARQGGEVAHCDGRLVNMSFHGAYFLSPRPLAANQPVELTVPFRSANGHAQLTPPGPLRLRGYVLRSEPLTSNGGWVGVAVHFPGGVPGLAPPAPATGLPAVSPKPPAGDD